MLLAHCSDHVSLWVCDAIHRSQEMAQRLGGWREASQSTVEPETEWESEAELSAKVNGHRPRLSNCCAACGCSLAVAAGIFECLGAGKR